MCKSDVCPKSEAVIPQIIFACLFLILICAAPAPAQSSDATLSGTVEDQQGAVVPGVRVTITNPATGLERAATTNDSGWFTVPLLPPGNYTLLFERQGFTRIQLTNIVLNVGDQKAVQVQLKVGAVTDTVEVRPDETLVDTSPSVSTTIDRTFVGNLPLNGRSFQSLILLTPGVVSTVANTDISPGQFSINGQRNNANYFTVDGVSANIGTDISPAGQSFSMQAGGALPGLSAFGSTNSLVSVDALQEFKIQTSTYSAEFGRQPGGQIQLATRSGTNDFHATAFDYLRNEVFDANNWFTNSRPLTSQQIAQGITKQPRSPLRQNQFGGTFSGPLMLPRFGEGDKPFWSGRNSTFFFFSYEGQRLRLPVVANFLIPSLRLRQVAAPALQPILNAFPLPTGPETTRIVNGVSVPSGIAPFQMSYSAPKALDATSIRIDHTVGSKLTIFGRYNESPSNNKNRVLAALAGGVFKTRTLTLGTTFFITPKLSNEFKANYSSNSGRNNFIRDNFGGAIPVDPAVLLSGYSPTGVTQASVTFALPGESALPISLGDQAANLSRQINIVDNVALLKGSHQFKFGIDYRRMAPIYGPTAYQVALTFRTESNVINGTVSNGSISASREVHPVFDNFSAYGQDTWKLSKKMTLDLGLRWELNPAPHDANGLRPVLVCGAENIQAAILCSPDTPFYRTFYAAFAPRVGVAYQLRQVPGRETVLRGGFGVYYAFQHIGILSLEFHVDKLSRPLL